jgi:HK97 family phage major capsid protein
MSKLEKLNDRKTALVAAMRKLSDKAADEEREFTAEEQTAYDQHKADLADADKAIAREQELVALEKSAILNKAGESNSQAGSVGSLGPETSKPNITREKDPNAFKSFGDFLASVKAFEHGAVDGRLQKYGVPSGLNTVTPAEGGFLVPPEHGSLIIKEAFETGSILSRVTRLPLTTSDSMTMPYLNETSRADGSRQGGVRGYWRGQGDSVTASKPSFGEMEIKLKAAMVAGYATDDMLKDFAFTGALLNRLFANELRFVVEDAIFEGDGAGKPQGLVNAACKIQIAKESGQAAKTICGDNVIKMLARFPVRSIFSPGAAWLYNQDCMPQLWKLSARTTATEGASSTSDAMPLLIPAGVGFNTTRFPLLGGIPLIPVEYCETLGTAGDLVLTDLSEYILTEKEAAEMASSMHVRFLEAEQTFRMMYRVDGQMGWKSAITPFKGSNSISPVITLAARA